MSFSSTESGFPLASLPRLRGQSSQESFRREDTSASRIPSGLCSSPPVNMLGRCPGQTEIGFPFTSLPCLEARRSRERPGTEASSDSLPPPCLDSSLQVNTLGSCTSLFRTESGFPLTSLPRLGVSSCIMGTQLPSPSSSSPVPPHAGTQGSAYEPEEEDIGSTEAAAALSIPSVVRQRCVDAPTDGIVKKRFSCPVLHSGSRAGGTAEDDRPQTDQFSKHSSASADQCGFSCDVSSLDPGCKSASQNSSSLFKDDVSCGRIEACCDTRAGFLDRAIRASRGMPGVVGESHTVISLPLSDSLEYSQTADSSTRVAVAVDTQLDHERIEVNEIGNTCSDRRSDRVFEQLGVLERWVEGFAASRLQDPELTRRALAASRLLDSMGE